MKQARRNDLRLRRARRTKTKTRGTEARPRLSIFRSLKALSAQVINDEKGVTLVSVTSGKIKAKNDLEGATKLGTKIGEECKQAKITTVVFDRNGYKYHGKIKAVAEAARAAGLIF